MRRLVTGVCCVVGFVVGFVAGAAAGAAEVAQEHRRRNDPYRHRGR